MIKIIYGDCLKFNIDNPYKGIMLDIKDNEVVINNNKIPVDKYLNNVDKNKLIILNLIYNVNYNDTFNDTVNKISNYTESILKEIDNYKDLNIYICSTNIQIIYVLLKNKYKHIGYFVNTELNFVDVDFYLLPVTRLNKDIINQMTSKRKEIMFFATTPEEKNILSLFLSKNYTKKEIETFYHITCS